MLIPRTRVVILTIQKLTLCEGSAAYVEGHNKSENVHPRLNLAQLRRCHSSAN